MMQQAAQPARGRSDLAFVYGYDWLAQRLHATAGPAACVLHEATHRHHMINRIPSLPLIGKTHMKRSRATVSLPAMGWVMPQLGQPDTLSSMRSWLQPGGFLYILAAGPFFSLLGAARANKRPYLQANQLLLTARFYGWRVHEWIGLRGTHALTWQVVQTTLGAIGALSLQERYHCGMRRSFAEHGLLRPFVALNCITLQRMK